VPRARDNRSSTREEAGFSPARRGRDGAGGGRDADHSSAEIAIDRKADVPVGVQLGWALHAQIRDGRLGPGEQLPTLRELAEQTGLNVNTVRAVYRRLEQQELIDSQQDSGTFAAAAPRRAAALSSIAAHAAEEARELGLDPREVAATLYVAPDAAAASDETRHQTAAADSEADRRQTLRRQIAAFERTLADLEAEHPGIAPAPARSRRGIGPALLSADELAQVRAALIRRLTVVQSAIDEHVASRRRAGTRAQAPVSEPDASAPLAADASSELQRPRSRPRPTTRPAPASG
jgi:DNA-binding transcriptional regulator YhcF (GntR family)